MLVYWCMLLRMTRCTYHIQPKTEWKCEKNKQTKTQWLPPSKWIKEPEFLPPLAFPASSLSVSLGVSPCDLIPQENLNPEPSESSPDVYRVSFGLLQQHGGWWSLCPGPFIQPGFLFTVTTAGCEKWNTKLSVFSQQHSWQLNLKSSLKKLLKIKGSSTLTAQRPHTAGLTSEGNYRFVKRGFVFKRQ